MKTTKDNDRRFKRVLREVKLGDGAEVSVGYFANEKHPDSEEFLIADIAAVNEFGTVDGRIPERSFLRSTVDRMRMGYRGLLHKLEWDVLAGKMSTKKALNFFGTKVVSDVKKTITTLKDPRNAPATVEQKGSDNPLIDTGTMRAKTKHKVKL